MYKLYMTILGKQKDTNHDSVFAISVLILFINNIIVREIFSFHKEKSFNIKKTK